MILENHGYRVLSTRDGPEALAIFAKQMNSIGAVLTDIVLPFMDGVTLIRTLKKMKVDVAFIASTGKSEHSHAPELLALGVNYLLTKLYDTQQLLKTLHDALAGEAGKLSGLP